MLKVTNDIKSGFVTANITILVLLDFPKAFDNFRYDVLCRKLTDQFAFSPQETRFINKYLSDRKLVVSMDGVLSNPISVSEDVLGPLLFSLLINDLPNMLQF